MRVGIRSGVVLAGRTPAVHDLASLARAGGRVIDRSDLGVLLAFGPGESPAFLRAARLAADLGAGLPPVAVVLHSPCTDDATDHALLDELLAIARPGETLVTEAFWRLAKDHFDFVALPDRLFRLGSDKVALPDVFVGRGAELHQLRSCWETARLGRPLLVSIQGEAGIGKSRFLNEFLSSQGPSFRVCSACSRPNEQQRPYAFLSSVVRSLGLQVGRLADELGASGADLDDLLGSEPIATTIQPRHRQFRAFRALSQVLRERLGSTPTILALEDLHWADEASLTWLDSLISELAFAEQSPPWLFVFTERGREIHRRYGGMGLGSVAIPLKRLGANEVQDLVAAIAPGLDETTRRTVIERSAGNPLYLREFVHLAEQVGAVAGLPANVVWELEQRLNALGPVDRRVVELAAVLGPEFDVALLDRLLSVPGFRQALANLSGAGLVVRGAETASFSHHLLYEAAYASLPAERRRELHAMVAHTLEADGASSDMVAWHLLKGPRPAQARPHLFKAARRARERYAHAEAKELLMRASRAGAETDALAAAVSLELAEVLLALGELEAARWEVQRIRAVVPDGERLRLAVLTSQLDERRGEYGRAIAALHDLSGADLASGERARLHLAEASLLLRQGEFAGCRDLAQRAIALLDEHPSLDRALAHSLAGIATYRLEGPERALPAYHVALDLREGLGDPAAVAGSLSNLGIAYYELGRWDEALSAFDRALETFRSIGERWQLTVVLNNRGHLLLNRGDVEAAEACYREALGLKREMAEEPGVAIALCNLGNALSRREAFGEARACLQEASHLLERLGEQETLAEVYQVYGMLELAAGDGPRARLLLERALEASSAVRRQVPRAIALRGLSQLAAQEARWEDAALFAWESVQLNDRLQNPLELGRSLVAWGLAQKALGDHERAMDAVDKASVLFRQLGALQDVRAIVSQLG